MTPKEKQEEDEFDRETAGMSLHEVIEYIKNKVTHDLDQSDARGEIIVPEITEDSHAKFTAIRERKLKERNAREQARYLNPLQKFWRWLFR